MQRNVLTTLKQPAYTGANRCVPCTIVNGLVAVVVSGAFIVAGSLLGATGAGVAAGLFALGASLSVIYLRGYLVPGTPRLTRRYLPERVLRWFGKEPNRLRKLDADLSDDADLETALAAAGVLEPTSEEDGYGLTRDFRSRWNAALETARGTDGEALRETFDVEGEVELDDFGSAFRVYADDEFVGKWPTRAAFLADLASRDVLVGRYDGWSNLTVEGRAAVLERVRSYLATCPDCEGTVERGTESVVGCCGTFQTTTATCTDCDARLSIETCPDCDSPTEFVSETVELDPASIEAGTVSCTDPECGIRVSMIPAPISAPHSSADR